MRVGTRRGQGLEAHGVAGPQDVAQHRRIVRALRQAPGFDGGRHQADGLGGDAHGSPACPIQEAHLAGREEPAPALLEGFQAPAGEGGQAWRPPDHDDGGVAAHDPEVFDVQEVEVR